MTKKILLAIATLTLALVCTACADAEGTNTSMDTDNATVSASDVSTEDTSEDTTAYATGDDNTIDTSDDDIDTIELSLTDSEIAAIIDKNLDILVSDSEGFFDEQDYIDAHPEAFAEIISLSEAALPYLIESADGIQIYDYSVENYRRIMSKTAAYTIKPALFDLIFSSPDDKYAVKATVKSFSTMLDPFSGISYHLSVIDNTDNNVVITSDDIFSISDSSDTLLIEWSPDSKYVAIEQSYRHYYSVVSVFDIQNFEYVILPNEEEVEKLLGKDLTYYNSDINLEFSYVHFYFDEWGEDTIKIRLMLSSAAGGGVGDGYYIYNLSDRSISYIEFDTDKQIM